jgi:hypothetical protein
MLSKIMNIMSYSMGEDKRNQMIKMSQDYIESLVHKKPAPSATYEKV